MVVGADGGRVLIDGAREGDQVAAELVEGDVYHWGSLMAGALLGSLPFPQWNGWLSAASVLVHTQTLPLVLSSPDSGPPLHLMSAMPFVATCEV